MPAGVELAPRLDLFASEKTKVVAQLLEAFDNANTVALDSVNILADPCTAFIRRLARRMQPHEQPVGAAIAMVADIDQQDEVDPDTELRPLEVMQAEAVAREKVEFGLTKAMENFVQGLL